MMTETLQIELPHAGGPDVLRPVTRELPPPGPGQALVRVEATGVSFAEQQMRLGKYYDQPPFPFVPGYDLVGVVEQLGGGPVPAGVAVGARVAALTKVGAWAEHAVVDVQRLVPVPAGLAPEQAEALVVNGLTAWRMLFASAKVGRGDTIVVLGAAGGVGQALVGLALHAGVRVIGTAGPQQQEHLRAQGVEAIDRRSEDVDARVRTLAPGGVAAVFDHVGGGAIATSFSWLARGGTLVSYGTAATKDDPGNARRPVLELLARLTLWNLLPNGRRARFFNLWAGQRRADRYWSRARHDLAQVLALGAEGRLPTPIAGRFALRDAAAALEAAETPGTTGKIVLLP